MSVTIADITTGPYAGNGTTVEFSYDFQIKDKSQVTVYEIDANGIATELTVDDDYTVDEIGGVLGGTITRTAGPLPIGSSWFIRSNYQPTQETSFTSQSAFFPRLHEASFDKLTYLIHQLEDKLGRTVRVKLSDTNVADLELPSESERADKFLGFDSDGNIEITIGKSYIDSKFASMLPKDSEIVQTMFDLLSVDVVTSPIAFLLNYHSGVVDGGGTFYWDSTKPKSEHNGGTIIDPTAIYPTDWSNTAQQEAWFDTSNTGTGCWVRQFDGAVNVKWFGYIEGNDNTEVIYASRFLRNIVILTTGQSNMVGSSLVQGGDQSTRKLVEAWNARFTENGTEFVTAQLGNTPFNGGGQQHIGFNAAKKLSDDLEMPVFIINMADGGQSIDRWLESDSNPYLWDAIQRELPLALAALGKNHVDYVYWHQGEANAGDDLMSYVSRFQQLKEQMASQSWWKRGITTISVGGLALGLPTTGTSGARPQMNLAFSLITEQDKEVLPVYTGDLETDSTGIHFTDESIVEIGKRYAKSSMLKASNANIQPQRFVESATNLTYDQSSGQFRDFDDLMDFISTLNFKTGARLDVSLPAGTYDVGTQRLNFEGNLVNFKGELDVGFVKPVKSDFTGVEATDLAMLQSRYLTEIVFTSTNSCLVLDGASSGHWGDMLFRAVTPLFKSTFIRCSDPSLDANGSGTITLENTALHGLNGNTCTAIQADEGSYVNATGCIISHCDAGCLANASTLFIKDGVIAYTANPTNATNRSFINAYSLDLIGQSGFSYVASVGSYVDARLADDNLNINTATNGIVET